MEAVVACSPAASDVKLPVQLFTCVPVLAERMQPRIAHVCPRSDPSAARSCSARNGSFWNSESSQRSSASESSGSPSRVPEGREDVDRDRRPERVEARRLARRLSRGDRSTGWMPNGRPSSVSKSTGPAAVAAAVVSRSALTASAISAGASGGSRRHPAPPELDHDQPVGLPTEVARQEAARLGPVRRQLAGHERANREVGGELDRLREREADERRDRHVLATLAEERPLELRVRVLERLVFPVEAAARLCGRDQEPEEDRAEERLVSFARFPACAFAKIAADGSRRNSSTASRASSLVRSSGSRSSMNARTSGRSS